jgi:hypothetical protein
MAEYRLERQYSIRKCQMVKEKGAQLFPLPTSPGIKSENTSNNSIGQFGRLPPRLHRTIEQIDLLTDWCLRSVNLNWENLAKPIRWICLG